LPILPLIVPSSTSTTSAASVAGCIGDCAIAVPAAFNAPSSSVSSQFATARPLLLRRTFIALSKYSDSDLSETSVRASSVVTPSSWW